MNGVQCGSPALKGRRLCYFHSRVRITRGSTNLPILEDINSVQHALMQVITALLAGKVDRQMAGLLLYGLQTASANLKRVREEAAIVAETIAETQKTKEPSLLDLIKQ